MGVIFRVSLILKFLFDKRIPLKEKWWVILPIIYMLSPVDLIPEPILGFGFVDDLVMLGLLLSVVFDKTKKYYEDETGYNKGGSDGGTSKIIENVEYEIKEDEEK